MKVQNIYMYGQHRFQTDEKPSVPYSLYRVVQFAVFATVFAISVLNVGETDHDRDPEHNSVWKWPIYTTNWTFTFCTLHSGATMAAVLMAARLKKSDDHSNKFYKLYKIHHVLYILATVNSFAVTILYWSIIRKSTRRSVNALEILMHGGNFLAMAVDFALLRLPWKIGHMSYPILSGLAYAIFSFSYYQLGGTNRSGHPFVYDMLDWRKPYKTFAFSILCLITQAVSTCVFIILYNLIEIFTKPHKAKKESSENVLIQN